MSRCACKGCWRKPYSGMGMCLKHTHSVFSVRPPQSVIDVLNAAPQSIRLAVNRRRDHYLLDPIVNTEEQS